MSTLSSLREKYEHFTVPAYKIQAGGSELNKAEFTTVYDISVDLSLGETCGACRFSLGDICEHNSRQILPAALEKLKPGATVAVSLGYGSKLTQVFFGYISETKLRFDEEGAELIVYGLDARGLMRENRRRVIYKDKKMGDIVNTILNDYSPLLKSKSVDAAALEQETSIAREGDDLSFLLEAADNRGLLLYMENDKFVMAKVADSVCFEFDWGQCAVEFGMKYLDANFTGTGCDPTKTERFSAGAPAKQKAAQAGLLTTERDISLGSYLTGDAAAKVVQSLADDAVRETLQGQITCRGVPEAALGQKIKINKFPLAPAKTGDTFSVVSVSHRLDGESGFTTKIGITG